MLPKGYLIGNLANDPMVGSSSTWNYARFSVACSSYEAARGEQERQSVSHFFDCIAWGKTAEYISKNVKKGDKVLVDYVLSTKSYNNNEGKSVKTFELRALSVEMVTKKHKPDNLDVPFPNSETPTTQKDTPNPEVEEGITLEDIFSE